MRALILIAALAAIGLDQPPLRPDPVLTPGAVRSEDVDEVCTPGYARAQRNTSAELKRTVFAEYGIAPSRDYEIDHLISLELGGADAQENLWPQSRVTQPWNAQLKDRLENTLHRLVCTHRLPLAVAQGAIAEDWITAYQDFIGNPPL